MLQATDIPFVRHIGIAQEGMQLSLHPDGTLSNHLNTLHAGAQYTLAETQSGLYLQQLFPELEGSVIPLLRDARIKYRQPAVTALTTTATATQHDVETFKARFDAKGRASIAINVEVRDTSGALNAEATFTWFVQAHEPLRHRQS
jgi:acyl-coenzyme A thioesterase PaaI-like protein